jgi:hypothetical protein
MGIFRHTVLGVVAILIVMPPAADEAAADTLNRPRLGGPLIDGSVARARGCGNHFFIAYREKFALVEWLGGQMVNENEVLQSDDDQITFEREGRATLTNLATGGTIEVVIEQALLNRLEFSKVARRVCR